MKVKDIIGFDVQIACHHKLLNYRKQDRLVQSIDFADAWDEANDEQRKVVLKLLKRGRHKAVRNWITTVFDGELWHHTIHELRAMARKYRIKNYSRLTKHNLIDSIIKEKEQENGS